jgi:hypothetical protein
MPMQHENVYDVQSTVKSGIDLERSVRDVSKERKLITPCHVKADSNWLLQDGDNGDNKMKRSKSEMKAIICGNAEFNAASSNVDITRDKTESSSGSESCGTAAESHNKKLVERVKPKVSRENSKTSHSKNNSDDFDKKLDVIKMQIEEHYESSELTDDRLGVQSFNTPLESHGRRHSSHSHDRDNKKSKKRQHESHRRKRMHDADFDERVEKDTDGSGHKRRRRSGSSSGSSGSRSKSHRHHRSDDRRRRRRSSSRSREEHGRGRYGKKSRAKRKSRSLSRLASFCCFTLRHYEVAIPELNQLHLILISFSNIYRFNWMEMSSA